MPTSDLSHLEINADRLFETLDRSAQIGPGKTTGLCRLALSNADKQIRDEFTQWCRECGCTVRVDQAGNMFARMEGTQDLPPVLIGSHLDTQIIRCLNDNGITPKRPIEVVNWANEEGARFAPPMSSSAVFAGAKTLEWLYGLTDDDGHRFGEELGRIGYKGEAEAKAFEIDAYFEFHIEQGPELYDKGLPLGIVIGTG
mgnify:CR=1 FL=1